MYIQTLGDFGEYKTKTFIESTQNFVTFLYYLRPQSDLKITQNKVEEKEVSEIVFWVFYSVLVWNYVIRVLTTIKR